MFWADWGCFCPFGCEDEDKEERENQRMEILGGPPDVV